MASKRRVPIIKIDTFEPLVAARNALVYRAHDAIKNGNPTEARELLAAARVAKALALVVVERRTTALEAMATIAGRELRKKSLEGDATYWMDGDVVRKPIDAKQSLRRLVEVWLGRNLSDVVIAPSS